MVVQRRGASEVGRVDVADDRPAAGPSADRDQPLDFEQAQTLPEGFAADTVLDEHRGLGRQPVALRQALGDDVIDDVPRRRPRLL